MLNQNQIKSMSLSKEVISFVQKLACEQNRSFSNMVETILKKEMEQKQKNKVGGL